PEKFKGKEVSLTKPLQYSKKGYLKKSLDIEGFTKDPVLSISAIKSRVAVDNLRDGFIKNTIDKYAVKTNTLSQQLTDAGIDISRLDKNGLVEKAKQVLNLEEYKPKGNLRFYKQTIQEYIPEKTNLPKIEPKTIKLEPDLETWKLKEEVASLEESLAQNPVRELTKYANKKTRELGEVTGKTESGKFARLGDDMASELGYANSEEARKAYSEYIRSLDNFRKLKSELADKKSNLKIKDYTSEQLDKINKLITETEKYSVKTKTILGVSKKVETHLLPKAIVEELNKFTTGGKSTLDKMFLPFDVFNRNWKPLATAVRPRYHTRNVLGNIYNSTVVAGNNPISFILKDMPIAGYQQIKSVISNSIKSNSLLGKVYQKFFGKVVDPDIIKLAVDNDVIGRGFFGADINDLTTAVNRGDDIMKTIKSINTPAEIYKVPVLKQWLQLSTKVGQFLEDNARLALFKQGLKKFVGNVDESKKYVNDHLFDYLTGLGEGDKMIKRFIPFWSWTRFNIPLQSKSLISTPLRYSLISKATEPYKKQVELTDEGYQYLTPEQQSAGFIKVGTTKRAGKEYDKYIKTASVIPLDDLSRLTDILQGKNEEIGITPLKQIYNLITNDPTKFKTYFGQPVESFTGEKKKFLGVGIRGRTKELLSTIPLLTEINKLIGGGYAKEEKPQPIIRVEQVLSPLGVSLVDKESNKFFSQLEKEKELTGSYTSGLQQIYKKYLKLDLKNKGKEKYVSDNVKILEKILKQKGLNEFDLLKIKNSAIKALLQDSFKIK
ncbi:MAG: hypothetical protein Q8L27_02985, partial [archaeon]|nr:hypothetical protein [archaeon]